MFDERNEIKLPPAFSGSGQLILYTRYGDPRMPGWENKWLAHWHIQQLHPWFPTEEIWIHKHFWPMLRGAFLELESRSLHTEINTVDCCYEPGHLHHSPVLSVHSWAAAIDLNATDNPAGTMGTWSAAFIKVMQRHGIYCGQCWEGSRQPMHFSMVDG